MYFLCFEVIMLATLFDRDAMARWYASEHISIDPGICSIYYLPTNAPEREIRLVEVNDMIAVRNDDTLEPVDFGVDTDMESQHKLFILDVTPDQWDRINESSLSLPQGWSLKDMIPCERRQDMK
jgi:hypothetical protein